MSFYVFGKIFLKPLTGAGCSLLREQDMARSTLTKLEHLSALRFSDIICLLVVG